MKTYIIAAVIFLFAASPAWSAGSSSVTPAPSEDLKLYNAGVKLMYDKKFPEAESQFRKALEVRETFAEAHNNLAYVLRKQGADHFDESLSHYNRAIELKPDLAQAYMYRGVLHVQMGHMDLAEADYIRLETLDQQLAEELRYVMDTGQEKEPEKFFGVSPELS